MFVDDEQSYIQFLPLRAEKLSHAKLSRSINTVGKREIAIEFSAIREVMRHLVDQFF